MNPIGQFLNVLFEHLTVNHAEKQTRLLIINGIVINISSVYKAAYSLAIKDGLVVAGNNFGDRHIVTTFHHPSGNTRSIDRWMIRGYEEETNKKTRLMGTTDVVNLIVSRRNCLKDQALLFAQTLLTQCLTILHRLHDGLVRVPVTELIVGNLVWIDIYGILHPLMMQYLSSYGCLARSIWPGNDNKNGLVISGYHVAEIFCASSRICSKKRVVASSFVRLASSAASFISCESTASEGSSILVNRYVSIVGFIIVIFLFSGASTVQTECNQVHLRSTSGRLLPKGRKNADAPKIVKE